MEKRCTGCEAISVASVVKQAGEMAPSAFDTFMFFTLDIMWLSRLHHHMPLLHEYRHQHLQSLSVFSEVFMADEKARPRIDSHTVGRSGV
jgi:hypothetical protein